MFHRVPQWSMGIIVGSARDITWSGADRYKFPNNIIFQLCVSANLKIKEIGSGREIAIGFPGDLYRSSRGFSRFKRDLLQSRDCSRLPRGSAKAEATVFIGSFFILKLLNQPFLLIWTTQQHQNNSHIHLKRLLFKYTSTIETM